MKIRILKYFALISVLLVLVCGCVKDVTTGGDADQATLTLNLILPAGAMETRSIAAEPSPTGENRIDDVAILALTKRGEEWVYDYQAELISKTLSGSNLTVMARVRGTSDPQQFVVLANASSELTADPPIRYEKISDIEDRLVCSTGGGEWPANNNNDGNFKPFPMYVRTGDQTITEDKTISTFQLLRMVARIEVGLKTGLNNFELAEACLFNYKTAGYVSYANSGLVGTAVTVAAVPTDGEHTGTPILEPTVMYAASSNKIQSSIYTFESPAIISDADKKTGTALVVGGYYNSSGTKSYYRIDFKEGTTPLALLRNHSYNVVIQAVTGEGYTTPKGAYLGEARLSAKVEKWSDADQDVIFDGQYKLKVSKDNFVIPAAGGDVELTAETDYFPTKDQGFDSGLKISVPAGYSSWLDADIINRTVIDGVETGTVQINVKPNASTTTVLEGEVHVSAGNMTKIINVKQLFKLPNLGAGGGAAVSDYTYVGAFWRADQTGERLIRIPVNSSAAGDWTVHVLEYGDFAKGDIVFSTVMSADPNIGWRDGTPDQSQVADMNDSTKDALYQVTGNDTFVTGTAVNGGHIFFRIGLKSTWTPTTAKPVRYAVIVLSYKGNTEHQKIWLRQGHEPDYLMRIGDESDEDVDGRQLPVKYSPYNLTHPNFKNGSVTTGAVTAPIKPATNIDNYFTFYPTQTGAFYQFNSTSSNAMNAYHPTNPTGAITTGWLTPATGTGDFWDNKEDSSETCPSGYRRPTDGTTSGTNATASLTAATSEMGQSLFLNPPTGTASAKDNSVWGYYADGFFDRRAISASATGTASSAVNFDKNDVAHIGRLMFNPNTHASIFFPATGHRNGSDRTLGYTGATGYYWSSSAYSNGDGWHLRVSSSLAYRNSSTRSYGFAVRCVAAE